MSANFTKGDVGEANKDASGLSAAQVYLLTYNSGCAMGWYFVLFKMGSAFIDGGGIQEVVNAAHDVVAVLQLISTLEILHSSVRLVVGRDLALFCVVTAFPAVRASPWVLMMFGAWTASEIIRMLLTTRTDLKAMEERFQAKVACGIVGPTEEHQKSRLEMKLGYHSRIQYLMYPFYALSVAGICPRVLHWLRYTAFIVLYPLGFVGELGTWIVGLPHIRALALPMLPGLPRGSSVYALYVHLLFAFGYGAPRLYMHMLRQRRKQMDGVRPKPKVS